MAHLQASQALASIDTPTGRDEAVLWGQYAAALKQLHVPADTAADLRELIRKVTLFQALNGDGSPAPLIHAAAGYRRHDATLQNKVEAAAARVRTDLGLPHLGGSRQWQPYKPGDSYP